MDILGGVFLKPKYVYRQVNLPVGTFALQSVGHFRIAHNSSTG